MLNINKGYFYLCTASLIFGSFELISKLIYGIEVTQINFIRFLVGGIVILPFALKEIKQKDTSFNFKDILKCYMWCL